MIESGHSATTALEDRKTVLSDWCVNQCLPNVLKEWSTRRQRRGTKGLLLHHDHASSHTAAATLDFLMVNCVTLVTHPLHSPHLAPCGWLLFPFIMHQFLLIQFQNPDEAQGFFVRVVFTTFRSTWPGVMHRWFQRKT